jgi:hypothetical protein
MKLYVFKIKEGKRDAWLDWCAYLNTHREEVEATLVQENCVYEAAWLISDRLLVAANWDGEKKQVDTPLNRQHAKVIGDNLEKVASFMV